jgi:hypothetical protein
MNPEGIGPRSRPSPLTPTNLRQRFIIPMPYPFRNPQSGFFEDLDLGVKKADSGCSVSGCRVGGLARRV